MRIVIIAVVAAILSALLGTTTAADAAALTDVAVPADVTAPAPGLLLHLTTTAVSDTPLPTDTAECDTTTVTLAGGTYSHGTRYHYDGDTYDRDGLTLTRGAYTWTICLLPVRDAYVQLARLRPATVPDTGPDASTVVHVRQPPASSDTLTWGAFLERTP